MKKTANSPKIERNNSEIKPKTRKKILKSKDEMKLHVNAVINLMLYFFISKIHLYVQRE